MKDDKKLLRPDPIVQGKIFLAGKKAIINKILDNFNNQPRFEKEIAKDNIDIQAIKAANNITGELILSCGGKPFDVSADNIHILPETEFIKKHNEQDTRGIYLANQQSILINANATASPYIRAATIFHEIIHLKSYLSFVAEGNTFSPSQKGIAIDIYDNKRPENGCCHSFLGLAEAVVSDIQKQYFNSIVDWCYLLKEEKARQNSPETIKAKEKIAIREMIGETDEIMHVADDGSFVRFPYYPQRKVLYSVAAAIFGGNDSTLNQKAVRAFYQAHFLGKTDVLINKIIKTFGKEFLVLLRVMSDNNSAYLLVNDINGQKR
ncbi:MAG: hypothetical protein V1905_03185 [bacterium]